MPSGRASQGARVARERGAFPGGALLGALLLLGLAACGGGSPGPAVDPGPVDSSADLPRDGADASPADAPDRGDEGIPPADAEPDAPPDAASPPDGSPVSDEAPADAGPPLSLLSVEPGEGPAGEPTTVTVRGTGFVDGMEVFFGPRKGLYPFVLSGSIANVTAPPGEAGVVDLRAVNPDGEAATLEKAFAYRGTLGLASVDPATGPSGGGTPVTLRGTGFLEGPTFLFGGREAPVVRVVDDTMALAITPPGDPGPAVVAALLGAEGARILDGFTFVDEGVPPSIPGFRVLDCTPRTGPPAGGTLVTIIGTGFRADASVRVGALPAASMEVVSDTVLTVRTPPGSPGPARIVVRQGNAGAWLDAFEYVEPGGPALLSVEPADGSWAGGTRVRLEGRNLQGVKQVFFGGGQATDVRVVSSVRVDVRTPRAFETGTVPVMVLGDGGDLGAAFTYFDPYLPGGGTWGGPARDSLNVAVTNSYTGRALDGAYVTVGADPHTPFQGRTDSRGQITLSDDGLHGPLVVTAAKEGFTASTIAGFDARNVTLSIGPAASPESPGLPPGSTGTVKTCTVRGRVKDYGKYLVKPPWVEGTPYVTCGTTSTSLFGGAPDPGPKASPDPEGYFEIQARSGLFGVVCQMMVVDPSKGWSVPLRIGVVRRVSCKTGERVDGLVVALDVETDADLWVATGPPPTHPMGGGSPYFAGGWELGEDGWLPLFQRSVRKGTRTLFPSQPRSFDPPLDGAGYSFYVTTSAGTPIGIPYSTVLSTAVPALGPWPVLVEDGAGFAVLPTGLRREITAMIPLEDGRALAADAGGATWEFDGTSFQVGPYRTSRAISGLWGASATDFWAVGARGMARHVVDGKATDVAAPVSVDFLGISGESNEAVSVAAGSILLRLSGDHFVPESLPVGTDVKAVRRFPDGEIVAAGAGGAVTTGRSGEVLGVVRPIARDLRAVAGLDRDEVWVVGDRGTVIRVGRDDVTAVTAPGEPDLAGVVVLGPSNVLLFGPGGTILHYDGLHFVDRSRPDLRVDLMAGASAGGRVLLAGRHFVQMPAFLPFPEVLAPAESLPWDGRRIAWSLGAAPADPSYAQAILSAPNGSSFWIVMAGGGIREVALPDLVRVLGESPVPNGAKRMNLTVSRSPGFDINSYGYMDVGFYEREAYSVALTSFP